jgi:WD40 repeat protein
MSQNLEKGLSRFSAPSERAVNSIAFSGDSQLLAVAQESGDRDDSTLSLVEVKTGECVRVIERTKKHSNGVYRVVFDTKRNQLIYVSQTNGNFSLNRFELDSGDFQSLDTSKKAMTQHGLSLDKTNHYLLVTGQPVKLWDLEINQPVQHIEIPVGEVESDDANNAIVSAISPDGDYIAIGGIKPGSITIYDIKTGNLFKEYTGLFESVQQLEFNYTGKQIASVDLYGRGVFLWNTSNGKPLLTDLFNEQIALTWSIRFSPKKNYLALGHVNSYVVIYDLQDGSEIIADKLHEGRVYDVCFSPNGKLLASCGEDGKVVVRSL